jgi:hypothetical protein
MFWISIWLLVVILIFKLLVYPYLKFKKYCSTMPSDVHICKYIPFIG